MREDKFIVEEKGGAIVVKMKKENEDDESASSRDFARELIAIGLAVFLCTIGISGCKYINALTDAKRAEIKANSH